MARRAASATGRHLAARSIDVTAVALIVLALLAVLALWIDSGGPFGTGMRAVILGLFGVAGYLFPVAAVFLSLLLFREDEDEPELLREARSARTDPREALRRRNRSVVERPPAIGFRVQLRQGRDDPRGHYALRAQTSRRPSSVRSGSTRSIVLVCGTTSSARPPVATVGASEPSSPRISSTIRSTWPAKP